MTTTTSTEKFCNKLSPENKQLVLLRLAEFATSPQIKEELATSYGIDLTTGTIDYYRENRRDDIARIRARLDRDLSRIPVANKWVRLKEIQKELDAIERAKPREGYQDIKLRLLEQARKEREALKIDATFRRGLDEEQEEPLTRDELKALVQDMEERHAREAETRQIEEGQDKEPEPDQTEPPTPQAGGSEA